MIPLSTVFCGWEVTTENSNVYKGPSIESLNISSKVIYQIKENPLGPRCVFLPVLPVSWHRNTAKKMRVRPCGVFFPYIQSETPFIPLSLLQTAHQTPFCLVSALPHTPSWIWEPAGKGSPALKTTTWERTGQEESSSTRAEWRWGDAQESPSRMPRGGWSLRMWGQHGDTKCRGSAEQGTEKSAWSGLRCCQTRSQSCLPPVPAPAQRTPSFLMLPGENGVIFQPLTA